MVAKKRNERQKKIGQASWKRAQDKKAENILNQEEARKANDEFRKAGLPTPYEERQRLKFLERVSRKYGQLKSDSVQ